MISDEEFRELVPDAELDVRLALAKANAEIKRMRHEARSWEYFAALAFAYFDAPGGTDDVERAWHELGVAITHWRETGSREPRAADEWRWRP